MNETQYLAQVLNTGNFPDDVAALIPRTTSVFYSTTSNIATKYYLTTTQIPPSGSTVNLYSTTSNIFINVPNTVSFLTISGYALINGNGTPMQFAIPTIDNMETSICPSINTATQFYKLAVLFL